MRKLFAVAAVLCFATMVTAPAFAQNKCQQRCTTNCSGKGGVCLNHCLERCGKKKK